MPKVQFTSEFTTEIDVTYELLEKYLLSKGWELVPTKHSSVRRKVFEHEESYTCIVLLVENERLMHLGRDDSFTVFAERAIKTLAEIDEDEKTVEEIIAEIMSI